MDDYFQRADWRVLKEDKETGAAVPDYVTRLGGKKGSAIICAPPRPLALPLPSCALTGAWPWQSRKRSSTAPCPGVGTSSVAQHSSSSTR